MVMERIMSQSVSVSGAFSEFLLLLSAELLIFIYVGNCFVFIRDEEVSGLSCFPMPQFFGLEAECRQEEGKFQKPIICSLNSCCEA